MRILFSTLLIAPCYFLCACADGHGDRRGQEHRPSNGLGIRPFCPGSPAQRPGHGTGCRPAPGSATDGQL